MNIGSGCYSCMINQVEKVIDKIDIPLDLKQNIMKEVFSTLSENDHNAPAPFIARELHSIINQKTGIADTFKEEKKLGNSNAMKFLPMIQSMIDKSSDKLETALRAAISGNIIDYGAATGSGEKDVIDDAVNIAMNEKLPKNTLQNFINDSKKAREILYIGDNTGEIAFDTFLVKELSPSHITFAVRGKYILNDATLEDAKMVSMNSIATVITTGDNTPGVDMSRASEEFTKALLQCDMIISKGQGNLETLYDADLSKWVTPGTNIYFLFKVKCPHVSKVINLPLGTTALIQRTIKKN